MLDEAVEAGARFFKACEVVKLSIRTVQRYRQHGEVTPDGRKAAAIGRIPGNRLSEQERTEILATANLPTFANLPPSQIVPALADEGRYIASESSFYRILRENNACSSRVYEPTIFLEASETICATRCFSIPVVLNTL